MIVNKCKFIDQNKRKLHKQTNKNKEKYTTTVNQANPGIEKEYLFSLYKGNRSNKIYQEKVIQ